MPTSPPAEAMPGGAPIKRRTSKRPCKYGPRDSDGLCPKKPRAAKTKKQKPPRKKPPCKYGPRDADGYCPKKPRAAAAAAAVTLANPRATPEQRAHAKQTIAKKTTSIISRSAEAGAGAAATEFHKQALSTAKRRARTKEVAIKVGKAAAVGAARLATRGSVLFLKGGGNPTHRAPRAGKAAPRMTSAQWATQELQRTEARLPKGQKLTRAQRKTLYQQYKTFFERTH